MTPVPSRGLMAIMCILGLMAGCSKRPIPESQPVSASLCARHLLRAADFGGILRAPIKGIQPLTGDAQSCEFLTASYPAIIVSVRPGLGRTTVDDWAAGKMALDVRPLPGIGDGAVWLETLLEVIAQKNAVLCDIQVRGGSGDLAVDLNALPNALGAVCNKIFAAY
jgi:hypothetical protein